MATLKAKLKRTLDPAAAFTTGVTRRDTFFDFSEPINGWSIDNATMLIDLTVLSFEEGAVSYANAIRCFYVLSYYDGYVLCRNNIKGVVQMAGDADANCRMWPCCAPAQMQFPLLYVANDSLNSPVIPNTPVGGDTLTAWAPDGVKYLQLLYGSAGATNPLRVYPSIDIQLYEGSVP